MVRVLVFAKWMELDALGERHGNASGRNDEVKKSKV
jgi:hypothetical protein